MYTAADLERMVEERADYERRVEERLGLLRAGILKAADDLQECAVVEVPGVVEVANRLEELADEADPEKLDPIRHRMQATVTPAKVVVTHRGMVVCGVDS